jgi:hypothetical protein
MTDNNGMMLTQANKEWASRPADERMPDLETMHAKALAQRSAAKETECGFSTLRLEAQNDSLYLSRGAQPIKLMNWAFTQLCGRVGAPSEYLAQLPATLAAQNLNHGLARRVADAAGNAVANVLLHKNSEWLVRAILTGAYERVWNCELTERLLDKQADGWEPARPDFNTFGDVFPSLYCGDRNMFAFIRYRNDYIQQPVAFSNSAAPIYKGFIVYNSEVGDKKLGAISFLYNGMCGNHLIWGARDVMEVEARHVGNVRDKLHLFDMKLREYARKSLADEQAVISRASRKVIAATKEQVLDTLFGKRSLRLSRKTLEGGYTAVIEAQDGPANTVWGMAQGLTRYSQTLPNADDRTDIDRAAGRLLEATDGF